MLERYSTQLINDSIAKEMKGEIVKAVQRGKSYLETEIEKHTNCDGMKRYCCTHGQDWAKFCQKHGKRNIMKYGKTIQL